MFFIHTVVPIIIMITLIKIIISDYRENIKNELL